MAHFTHVDQNLCNVVANQYPRYQDPYIRPNAMQNINAQTNPHQQDLRIQSRPLHPLELIISIT